MQNISIKKSRGATNIQVLAFMLDSQFRINTFWIMIRIGKQRSADGMTVNMGARRARNSCAPHAQDSIAISKRRSTVIQLNLKYYVVGCKLDDSGGSTADYPWRNKCYYKTTGHALCRGFSGKISCCRY